MDEAVNIDVASQDRDLDRALDLAQKWTRDHPTSAPAWGKLAYVHEMRHDFDLACEAIEAALKWAPNKPSYRFKAGLIRYRLADYDLASQEFAHCVQASLDLDDAYYLDAAKIAQALCLIKAGRLNDAEIIMRDAPNDAATWVDGRVTGQSVRQMLRDLGTA